MSDTNTKWIFSQDFYQQFQVKRSDIASRLDAIRVTSTSPSSLEGIQALTVELAGLAKCLTDATGSLPSYDQRQCEQQLKALEKTLDDLRTIVTPKPKFSFKRKQGSQLSSPVINKPSSSQSPATSTVRSTASTFTISSYSHRYLALDDLFTSQTSTSQSEVSISDIDNSIINLLPSKTLQMNISALHIQNLSDTILVLPPVKGSIILHALSNCVVVAACHQFRMHRSTKVDVYLSIPSNAIIEHCHNVRFASYPESIQLDPKHQNNTTSTLNVQDFSHIRSTPSPNWSTMPEEQAHKIWTRITSSNESKLGDDLKDVLPS